MDGFLKLFSGRRNNLSDHTHENGGETCINDTFEPCMELLDCLDEYGPNSPLSKATATKIIQENPQLEEALTVKFATIFRLRRELQERSKYVA